MTSITISKQNYRQLIEISAKLQQKEKRNISMNDVIDYFIDFYNNYENAEKLIFNLEVI